VSYFNAIGTSRSFAAVISAGAFIQASGDWNNDRQHGLRFRARFLKAMPPTTIAVLLDDARFWIEHNTYPPDETAVRVHHRLVWIHPFPNGNGRHARLMADLLIEKMGGEAFSWGGGSLADVSKLRTRYIAALQAADGYDIGPLLAFARS
jgi:Fic-DOC domain mobile mystery protein B